MSFSSTKLEKKAEQVLPGSEGSGGQRGGGRQVEIWFKQWTYSYAHMYK
jgi:hypothetical protein